MLDFSNIEFSDLSFRCFEGADFGIFGPAKSNTLENSSIFGVSFSTFYFRIPAFLGCGFLRFRCFRDPDFCDLGVFRTSDLADLGTFGLARLLWVYNFGSKR